MNKKCFRVIFSKTLQRLIVTSELAKAEGKSKESNSFSHLQIFARIRLLVFGLFFALGFVTTPTLAETLIIQADKSAPKNQQPIILQTANGLPQVNIQTPNDKGLSHNKYSKFDVDTKGAILNNSRTNVQTQQAGWVQGNPYLAKGEAKVILNEVNSNDPSLLKGYVEVAGKKADVIIANPSGIHCQGCGIINSDRVTLTTGKPQIQHGNLESFVVEKGKVSIDGKGLDNSRVDYTEILAREVQANAGVWSKKETKVITGKNTLKRKDTPTDLQIIHSNQPLVDEAQPQFAVDIGELGGMYSGKIHLIGTEQGVGVRNAGHIGASAESLTIDSKGRIINTGTLNANQAINLTAAKGIANTGKIENRQGDIKLTTKADINQDGSIVARQGNIQKHADTTISQQGETVAKGDVRYQAQTVNASQGSLIAAGVTIQDRDNGEVRTLDTQSAQGKSLHVTATEQATLQGKNIASGTFNLRAGSVNLDHSQNSAHIIVVQGTTGSIDANSAHFTAQADLQLNTPEALSTQSSHLTANKIRTEQALLNAQNATWKQTGTDDFHLKGNELITTGAALSTQGDFKVEANQLDNAQGTLSSAKSLTLKVEKTLNSEGGQLLAGEDLQLTTSNLNNDGGLVYAKQDVEVVATETLHNQNTKGDNKGLVAGQRLSLSGKDIDNTQGKIAGQQLAVEATQLRNDEGALYAKETLNLNATQATNHQGLIVAEQQASLSLSQLEQKGGQIEAQTLEVNTDDIRSTNNSLIFAENLKLTTQAQLVNQESRIVAKNDGQIVTGGPLDNQRGTIGSQMGSLTLNTHHHNLDNTQGNLVAAQQLHLASSTLHNVQGLVSAKQVALNASQAIHNQHTQDADNSKGIVAQNTLEINTQHLNNDNGNLQSNQSLQLTSTAITNQSGHITARGKGEMTSTTFNNDNGRLRVGEQLDLNTETFSQVAGLVSANVLNLIAKDVISTQGSEISGNTATLTVDTLNNRDSKLVTQQAMTVEAKSGIQNQGGVIASLEEALNINTHQSALNNAQGVIAAQKATLNLQTGNFDNQQGSIRAERATINTHQHTLDNRNTLTESGQGIVVDELTLHTHLLDNQQGRVTAKKSGTIDAQEVQNQSGEILAKNSVQLNSTKVSNQSGTIAATQGNLNITTRSVLENQQGQISAVDQLTLDTHGLANQQGNVVSSNQLSLNTHQHATDNQQGKIFAQQRAEVNSGAVNNQQGLIRAEKHLSLNTHAQQLDNRHTQGKEQGVVGLGDVVLKGISNLLNQRGTLYAENALNATVQHNLNNTQGIIQSNNQLTLSASSIDNQAGKITAKSNSLTANQINNRANESNGSLISGETLNLNVQQLDNQNTKATADVPTQGIQATHLTLQADTLNNQQGGIYTTETANLTATTRLDNTQGELLSGNRIDIKHTGQLMLNNQDGLIQGANQVNLNAKGLESEGRIKTAGDLAIGLKDSFTLNNAFEVGNNLTFNTEGDFENNTVQRVKNKAIFTANRITNNVNAEISANDTTLNSQALTNRGLIDGGNTRINSTSVTNIGTGRIYGNHLAFKSQTISNLAETVNGETKAGTIAAREKLDVGVETLTNRDHALILSLGNLAIGGELDSEGNAVGKATFVDNGSATIEALGNGRINTARLLNHDLYFRTGIQSESAYIEEFTPFGRSDIYYGKGPNKQGWLNWNNNSRHDRNAYFEIDNGPHIGAPTWYQKFYTRTTNTTTLEHKDPAKILIGGNLHLEGDKLTNQQSNLSIGAKLYLGNEEFINNPNNKDIVGSTLVLENKDLEGIIHKVDRGETSTLVSKRKRRGRHRVWAHYTEDIDKEFYRELPVETFDFGVVLNPIGIKLNSTATVESHVAAKDVALDTVSINSEGKLDINTVSVDNPTIQGSGPTHIVLTPAIDEQDKNKIINSGQVIGKLDTTIEGSEVKDLGNLKLPTIKTHLADITLPQASLYQINPDNPTYLVETDPRFTQRDQWLSSDYMLNQLRHDHNLTHKRLGDGFYEQRLISEQINQLTGRRFIEGHSNDLEQYKALMNSGVQYAKQFNLAVGVGLTAQQMSELTTDMVWLVNKEVTLPNGQKVTALTPQVYLVARNSDITSRGAVMSANEIVGNIGELKNEGVIAGRDLTRIHSNQLENRGVILGQSVDLSAKQNLINLGGRIEAVDSLALAAGQKLEIASTLSHAKSEDGNFERTIVDQVGVLKVTGENGSLKLNSDNLLTIKGALVESHGTLRADAKDIDITTLHIKNKEHYNGNADNYYRLDQQAEVGSQLIADKGVTLVAEKAANLRQATLSSLNGNVTLAALQGNIILEAGRAEESLSNAVKSTSKGFLSKRTSISQHEHHIDAAVVNSLQGQNVTLYSGNILTDEGSEFKATENIHLEGQKGVVLNTAQSTRSERNYSESKKSGFTASLSNGIARIGVGRSKQQDRDTEHQAAHIGAQLTTQNGNITVVSTQGDVTAHASKFESKNDITVAGKNVHLKAKIEEKDNTQSHTSSSKGFGIGVVYNPVETFKSRYGEQSSQGSAGSVVGKSITAGEAFDKTFQQVLNGASPYLTANKKQSERFAHTETANVVEMNAGGNLSIQATEGDITSQGAHLTAKGDGSLRAKGNVDLGVATTEQSQTSQRKQKGVDIDLSRRLTEVVGAYHGKEKGDSTLIQEHASVISFGGKGTIEAEKGNVTLAGTQFVSDGDVKVFAGNDVITTTAKTSRAQSESSTRHGFGEAVVSETERFSGYNRKLSSQEGKNVSHQGSMIASLNGNVDIYANKNLHQTSGQVLAKEKIRVSAESVTTDAAHNTQQHRSHQSDLKIGQFTRVISPVIDLINAVESSVKNKEASDRVKAAQLLGLAAQGYTLQNMVEGALSNPEDKSVLFRVESGTGLSHSRQRQSGESSESVGNQFNAKQIEIEARSGKLSATHTDFTAKDKEGNRIAGSEITLTGKQGIELKAGESQYRSLAKNQSYGTEVGTAVSVGAKTGWSFYAKEGFNKGKQESEGKTYQNSHLDAQTIHINSGGDVTLAGATAKANTINADIQGKLTIESLQDEHTQKGKQVGFGTKVEFGFGSAWEFSGNANASGGSGNSRQVNEQSGFFAEAGGYHVTAKEVHLEGGAIASSNPSNSELTTNTITFKDIHNSSNYSATSGAIAGGYSQSNGTNVSPSLPMHEQGKDSTTTKATLTEGKITLNKDSNPIETTAAALGINTDITEANKQVEVPKDVNQLLKEQQLISQNVGEIGKAASVFSSNQAKKLDDEAKAAEKAGDLQTAKAKRKEAESWQVGGENKRKVDALTSALSLALAGQSPQAIATGAASPYVNQAIKDITKDIPELNIPAHILWGAIEAELTGGKASTGAIAAGVGEAAAPIFSQALFGDKKLSELTAKEKEQILNLSKLAAGVASGLIATGNSAENLVAISQGMKVAENAVENNYLSSKQKALYAKELSECQNLSCKVKTKAYWNAIDLGQDASFATGVIAGVPESAYDMVSSVLDMAMNPIETLDAMKAMISQDDAFSKIADSVKQSYIEQINKLETEYQKAGASGSFNAGRETGKLLVDLASVVTGVGGAVKGVTKVGTEAVTKGMAMAKKVPQAVGDQINKGMDKFGKLGLKQDVISNKKIGIDWNGSIKLRGESWEKYLQSALPKGTIDLNKIKNNFKAFDHLLPDGTAISAKTMDTVGGYKDPKRITYQLNRYVDQMVQFKGDGKGVKRITNKDISKKEMYLAIPYGTSTEKIQAINKSVDYAKSQGVSIIVREIK